MKSLTLVFGIFVFACASIRTVYAQYPTNLDIVILVDVSGSMEFALDGCNWSPGIPTSVGDPPYPGMATCVAPNCASSCVATNCSSCTASWQRLYYIQPGLQALGAILQKLEAPTATGGFGISNINFAIGRFPGLVVAAVPQKLTWLEDSGNALLRPFQDRSELDNIVSSADLDIRWDGTPIGNALCNDTNNCSSTAASTIGAIDMLLASPTSDKVILLFTDGKRYGGEPIYNGMPMPDQDDVLFKDDVDQLLIPADVGNINVVSLGIGTEYTSEIDFPMLTHISKYWDYYDPLCPDLTMPSCENTIFTKAVISSAFASIWSGPTIALTDPTFMLDPGDTNEHTTYVTSLDRRLLYNFSWNDPKTGNTIQASLRMEDGTTITPTALPAGVSYDTGATFQMYTLEESFLQDHIGEVDFVVNGDSLLDQEVYGYSVLGYSDLQLLLNPGQRLGPLFTGDYLSVEASFNAGEAPIPDARVTALVTGPDLGPGNWFAQHPLSIDEYEEVVNLPYPGQVENFHKKYFYVHHIQGEPLPSKTTAEFALSYDATDSLYKGIELAQLTKPGIYTVKVSAAATSADGAETYLRDQHLNYYVQVRPEPDWERSSIEFTQFKDENERFDFYRAKITLRDVYGNYLKPGQEERFAFRTKNAVVSENAIFDDLEGSYYQTFAVPRNAVLPTVDVQFNGFMQDTRIITDNPRGDNWRINPTVVGLHVGAVSIRDSSNFSIDNLQLTLSVRQQLTRRWGLRARLGYNRIENTPINQSTEYLDVGAGLLWYPIVQPGYRLYTDAGGGYYFSEQAANDVGFHLGVGVEFPLSPSLDLDLNSTYNNVLTSSNSFEFIQVKAGVLIRF